MNPILYFPQDPREQPKPLTGSGRYYARLSQTESIPAAVGGGFQLVWIFEGIDAQWFDANPEPPDAADWIEYYDRIPLFILELLLQPNQLGQFGPFKTIQSADDEDDEPEDWFSIMLSPTEGRVLGEAEIPIYIYSN